MTRCEALKEKLLETLAQVCNGDSCLFHITVADHASARDALSQAPVLPPPSATPAAGPGPAPIRRDSILYGGVSAFPAIRLPGQDRLGGVLMTCPFLSSLRRPEKPHRPQRAGSDVSPGGRAQHAAQH
jgi:hypothetical protein